MHRREQFVSGQQWNWSVAYQYDKSSQLTSEVQTGSGVGAPVTWAYNNHFEYDRNGNRMSHTLHGLYYGYIYVAPGGDRLASGEGFIFQRCDADGNPFIVTEPAPNSTVTYEWNDLSQLIGISYRPGLLVSRGIKDALDFRNMMEGARPPAMGDNSMYDSAGHRVKGITGGVVTWYIYSGDTLIAQKNGEGYTEYEMPGVDWLAPGEPNIFALKFLAVLRYQLLAKCARNNQHNQIITGRQTAF